MDSKIRLNRVFGDLLENFHKYGEVIFSTETKNEDPAKLIFSRQATITFIRGESRVGVYFQIEVIAGKWSFEVYCKKNEVSDALEIKTESTESIEDDAESVKMALDTYLTGPGSG